MWFHLLLWIIISHGSSDCYYVQNIPNNWENSFRHVLYLKKCTKVYFQEVTSNHLSSNDDPFIDTWVHLKTMPGLNESMGFLLLCTDNDGTVTCFQSVPGYALTVTSMNSSLSWQNGCHFTEVILKCIFWNENVRIFIQISLKFAPMGQVDSIKVMAWHQAGNRPLPKVMLISALMHICGTREVS